MDTQNEAIPARGRDLYGAIRHLSKQQVRGLVKNNAVSVELLKEALAEEQY